MGRAKHEWIEAQERGWSAPETFVCSDCVGDEFLAEVVDASACETECSYCDTSSTEAIAAPLEEIMVHVSSCKQLQGCKDTHSKFPLAPQASEGHDQPVGLLVTFPGSP